MLISGQTTVVEQFATETQYGLCPPLYNQIRPLGIAATDKIPQQFNVKEEIDWSILTPSVSGQSLYGLYRTSGFIFKNNKSNNTLGFKSLSFEGPVYPEQTADGSRILLKTTQTGNPGTQVHITKNTNIGGGAKQYLTSVCWKDFNNDRPNQGSIPQRGVTILPGYYGDCVGKIIIQNAEPWAFPYDASTPSSVLNKDAGCCLSSLYAGPNYLNYSTFCIGTKHNISGIVKPFMVPSTTGQLVSFEYGSQMWDRVQYVEHKTPLSGLSAQWGDNFGYYTSGNLYNINNGWVLAGQAYVDIYRFGTYTTVPTGSAFDNTSAYFWLSGSTYNVRSADNAMGAALHFATSNDSAHRAVQLSANANWSLTFEFLSESRTNTFDVGLRAVNNNWIFRTRFENGAVRKTITPLAPLSGSWSTGKWNTVKIVSCDTFTGTIPGYGIFVNDRYIGSSSYTTQGLNAGTLYLTQVRGYGRTNFRNFSFEQCNPLQATQGYLRTNDDVKIYKLDGADESTGKLNICVYYDPNKIYGFKRSNSNRCIYFSGRGCNTYQRSIEIFDVESSTRSFMKGENQVSRTGSTSFINYTTNDVIFRSGIISEDLTTEEFVSTRSMEKYQHNAQLCFLMIDSPATNFLFRGSGASDWIYGYSVGGYSKYSQALIQQQASNSLIKYEFSNNSSHLYSMTSPYLYIGDHSTVINWPTFDSLYVIGGKSIAPNNVSEGSGGGQAVNRNIKRYDFTDKVKKISTSTMTVQSVISELLFNSEGHSSVQQVDKIWTAGGINRYDDNTNPSGYGDPIKAMQYFEISTGTSATKASTSLLIPRGYGTMQMNGGLNTAIFSGGGDLNLKYGTTPLQTNIIEIFDFSTDTGFLRNDARLTTPRVGLQGAAV